MIVLLPASIQKMYFYGLNDTNTRQGGTFN